MEHFFGLTLCNLFPGLWPRSGTQKQLLRNVVHDGGGIARSVAPKKNKQKIQNEVMTIGT
jgi:hypothetical protein